MIHKNTDGIFLQDIRQSYPMTGRSYAPLRAMPLLESRLSMTTIRQKSDTSEIKKDAQLKSNIKSFASKTINKSLVPKQKCVNKCYMSLESDKNIYRVTIQRKTNPLHYI
jgi:hypothetical protein